MRPILLSVREFKEVWARNRHDFTERWYNSGACYIEFCRKCGAIRTNYTSTGKSVYNKMPRDSRCSPSWLERFRNALSELWHASNTW